MSTCPRLEIDYGKIKSNSEILANMSNKNDIKLAGVTKSFCAIPEIAKAMVEGGAKILADARIKNLKKLKDIEVPKLLLRLPMISRVDEVVEYADISLNSELKTIEKLSEAAIKKNKIHKIILMVDLGDLREGLWPDAIISFVAKIIKLEGIKLYGLGTNLTCYGGIIPTKENLGKLAEIAEKIENEFDIKLEIVSGGNSSSLDALQNDEMPKKINNLRVGEAIVLGRETAYGKDLEGAHNDAFTLVAEIIEIKEKPSVPIGKIGMDAFGNKPTFEDRGIRKRAILAIGRQDVNPDNLSPIDDKIIILGGSSDHILIDVTDSKDTYDVGEEVKFNIDYGALLQLTTSEYITKKVINK